MNSCRIFLIFVIFLFIISVCKTETFDTFGYNKDDVNTYFLQLDNVREKYAVDNIYKCKGYDNPFIYPYSYFYNPIYPNNEYPQWIKELSKDENKGFSGYGI